MERCSSVSQFLTACSSAAVSLEWLQLFEFLLVTKLSCSFLGAPGLPIVDFSWTRPSPAFLDPVGLEKQTTVKTAQLKVNPHVVPDAFWESLASTSCSRMSCHLPRMALLSSLHLSPNLGFSTWLSQCPWQWNIHSHAPSEWVPRLSWHSLWY